MATVTRIPERGEPLERGVERVVEASRELFAGALRPVRLELVSAARRALIGALLFAASVASLALAWVASAVALALFLARAIDPAAGVASVALGHLVLAVGCALFARRRGRSGPFWRSASRCVRADPQPESREESIMATATQTATDALRERASEANEVLHGAADRARSELEPILRRADEVTRRMVADYPLTTLVGAVAAGYVVGRMLATRR
jgi:ElaB/YqjD/DUF883 family membrane-anchored ribosome-binding protein